MHVLCYKNICMCYILLSMQFYRIYIIENILTYKHNYFLCIILP